MDQLNSKFPLQSSTVPPHLYPISLHQTHLLTTLMIALLPQLSLIMAMELDPKALDVVDYFFRLSPFLYYIKSYSLQSNGASHKINFNKALEYGQNNH